MWICLFFIKKTIGANAYLYFKSGLVGVKKNERKVGQTEFSLFGTGEKTRERNSLENNSSWST